MKVNLEGRYTSTYGFVGNNGLEKHAEMTFGKNWEAEDDVEQIQQLCDYIEYERYQVDCIETRDEEDIIVREVDNWKELKKSFSDLQIALEINKSNLMQLDWFNDFVDFVQEYDDNIYNKAREWADNQEAKKE
jgi:hypothetical protein